MNQTDLLNRISISPKICFGRPCIKDHRIWVSLILDLLASGEDISKLLDEYPQLEKEDILACIAYAAAIVRDGFVEIEMSTS